ncbi:hypothetical protein KCP75_06980 [Salmonella enterica subsp. enterica]|nr:hypothetical protein KCP75_06980 [Salmonella enterica subsp. enterica]
MLARRGIILYRTATEFGRDPYGPPSRRYSANVSEYVLWRRKNERDDAPELIDDGGLYRSAQRRIARRYCPFEAKASTSVRVCAVRSPACNAGDCHAARIGTRTDRGRCLAPYRLPSHLCDTNLFDFKGI